MGDGPTFDQPMRRTSRYKEREAVGQGEAGEVTLAPGEVDRFLPVDAGLAKLTELSINVMQPVPLRIAIRQRAAVRDAGPLGATVVRQQLEIAAGAGGGL